MKKTIKTGKSSKNIQASKVRGEALVDELVKKDLKAASALRCGHRCSRRCR